MVAIFPPGSGIANGVPRLKAFTGQYLYPAHLKSAAASAYTTTAARYVFIPFWLEAGDTWTGVAVYNTGAGDTGEKMKIAVYNYDLTTGAPSTVANNFGEITLTAAAAERRLASPWTVTVSAWYYLAFVADNTFNLAGASPFVTAAGAGPSIIMANPVFLGPAQQNVGDFTVAYYVAGTYANFPEATAITPTTDISGGAGTIVPAIALYK